jgi:hypothetical protein
MSKKELELLEYTKNMGTQRLSLMAFAQGIMNNDITDMHHARRSLEIVFRNIIQNNAWVNDSIDEIVRPTVDTFLKQQEALLEAEQSLKDKS